MPKPKKFKMDTEDMDHTSDQYEKKICIEEEVDLEMECVAASKNLELSENIVDEDSVISDKDFDEESHLASENLEMSKQSCPGEKNFRCTQCGKTFGLKNQLHIHYISLTGEKCPECYRSLHGINVTEDGSIVSSSHKLYQCSKCDKCFVQSGNLKAHLRTHSGEKPFMCTKCGKCFRLNGTLTRHYRSHTGEKPYKCLKCGKSFTYCSQLSIHHKTMCGEKPYQCTKCSKTFTANSSLKRHYNVHVSRKC